MSLKTRLLGLAAALMIIASVASWLAYRELSDDIIERWGQQVAEIQVRYDSARLLQSLEREIGLARQMADSSTLVNWATSPEDKALQSDAIREMESFRSNFRDNSYFVALRDSRRYYYNNANNEFANDQFRYILDPDKPEDAWFFQLIEEGRNFHLNVNPDTELGVTKLWIDVLMRDEEDRIVGMVGTGLDLDAFLQDIVDIDQEGITTLFVDYNGAIQLYRDRNYIDFASIIKPEGQKSTVDLLFDNPEDKQKVLGMLQLLKNRGGATGAVESSFVTVDGRKHLAGVAFLPAIGWFEITLLDLETLLPRSYLWPLVAVFLTSLLVTLILFHLIIRSRILKPLVSLESAVEKVRGGSFALPHLEKPDNEIGRLASHFETMTDTLEHSTRELERKVAQRTDELNRLARVDALTGLKNRRGLDEALDEEIQRAKRQNTGFGLIWLDIDHFKAINDELGHQAGDDILCRVALWLKAGVRPYDHPGRWGGDEFVVVLSPCDEDTLCQIAARIRETIERDSIRTGTPVTVSVGGYLCQPGDDVDTILRQADQALYRVKQQGRNKVLITDGSGQEINPA
ncbi:MULTISPECIES: sensor domain-containing diguanylate cyclase [Marinobacter]|uniref:diguanylate cyclase n=2 Tax=Marinobacter TaxID=2742 RepID=A0A1W6K4X2_9GAMM|nr:MULTISPECIES: diguanylate cyclase [Marinobacter]ARM82474.1 diguanylate cyclase DosC [Marinobacter salarius]KXJ45452.1 MAG: diguanylate cyclase [Marinobacter sp. Hex_13]MAB53411.1 GGDEF domain-containing protein [Marinobacter sp.]MBJ7300424.1 diguanylate cyclase [Marinobacter salarius]MBL84846.1 GGDEF domain-containing protein [Marinobacter sp.]